MVDKDDSMSSSETSSFTENSASVVGNGCLHSKGELSTTNGSEANGAGEGSRTPKLKAKLSSKLRQDVLYDVERLDEEGRGRIIPDIPAACLQ